MWYQLITIKRTVEQLLMLPFVTWGRLKAQQKPLAGNYDMYCFFPNPGIGGAEKVNANVVKACNDKKIIIFFTKKIHGDSLAHLYIHKNVTVVDISIFTDNKKKYWQNFIYRGICSQYINRQYKKPVVFIGQCNFGYKLLPHLKQDIFKVELIHVSERKFAQIVFPFVPFLNKRITIAKSIAEDFKRYYKDIGIPQKYAERWEIISNCVPLTLSENLDRTYTPLKVYYAGRGGYQKRVWLIIEIIRQCHAMKFPIEFHLAGPLENEIPADTASFITYDGIITGEKAIYSLHQQMDILLMTSAFEGFPLVIMEAMANGVIPLVTAVDAIPEHIKDGWNGFLIRQPDNEEEVIRQGVQMLKTISVAPEQLKAISNNAFNYALEHFSESGFIKKYRKALFGKE